MNICRLAMIYCIVCAMQFSKKIGSSLELNRQFMLTSCNAII